ncbi:MAG: hypothetical protein M1820_001709 [Bogoriella megaspora]|nr:MAG: hypothetical protein M1820_001709 [Bogoriella megaspora]
MAEVTLIDIPTQPTEFCWSPNTWKTRILLNYKGIPYDTEWVEYPDLADKLKGLGIPPNDPDEIAPYTAPSVIFKSDGKSFMESFSIAAEINKRYPNPPLPCDTQIQAKASECIQKLFACVVAELIPRVPSILPPRSAEYFHETRKDRFGMSLEDFANEKGGLKCWGAAEEPLKQLAGLLKENDSGPFFEGEQGESSPMFGEQF